VLIEGAQGALLDLDHGTYPYVTSSTTLAGGACAGLGIGPTLIDQVWGITKAYATRVGAGPFPTHATTPLGEQLRQAGAEFGATTGRPRDCGWLDLPALRHAARLNGLTGLCITKLDVLAALPRVQLCTRYQGGAEPGVVDLGDVVPEYEEVPGWGDPSLPDPDRRGSAPGRSPVARPGLSRRVETAVGVPIVLVSVGPDRGQTILTGPRLKLSRPAPVSAHFSGANPIRRRVNLRHAGQIRTPLRMNGHGPSPRTSKVGILASVVVPTYPISYTGGPADTVGSAGRRRALASDSQESRS
jgi:adenylosuccinate synthase